MRIVVTGATGHIGACLVRRLVQDGHNVLAIARHATTAAALKGLPIERADANVCDADKMDQLLQGAEIVYHLAACIAITSEKNSPVYSINVEGTRFVGQAALKNKVKRFIHLSSIHAYDLPFVSTTINEDSPHVPAHCKPVYNRSKSQGEKEIRQLISEGLDAVIINPAGVIGPNDYGSSLTGKMFLLMFQNKLPAAVNGGFFWIDVRDLTDTLITAIERGRCNENYLVCGHYCKIIDLFKMTTEITGRRAFKPTIPMWLARLVAPLAMRIDRLLRREALFTPESLLPLRSKVQVDCSKAATELGYQARPLVDSLRDTHLWFIEQGKLEEKTE